MVNIKVIDKTTQAAAVVKGQEVTLSGQSIVELPIARANVKSLARNGSDLVVTTTDGETIVIHEFFVADQDPSDLMLLDDGGLYQADLGDLATAPEGAIDLSADNVDSVFPYLEAAPQEEAAGGLLGEWSPLGLAAAGFATALTSAAALGGGGDTHIPPTITGVTQNPDGTLTVTGRGNPGDTITVHYPSGKTGTGQVGSDGNFTVTSPGVEGSGKISVTATDPSGNTVGSVGQDYVDQTPPEPPTVNITQNENGGVHIEGKAEPGSNVTAYLPDGTTATATADADGNYVIDAPSQPNGKISVVVTDPAGNKSDPVDQGYIDDTPPKDPTVNVTPKDPDDPSKGTHISGNAEPGSTVTIHYPDGSTATYVVGPDGKYDFDNPSGDPVTITVTDPAGNQSNAVTPPTMGVITPNDGGGIHVEGTAKPGSTVTVTYPDGSSEAFKVGDDGKYSFDSATPQGTGNVVVTVTDPLGNTTGSVVQHYTDTTPPAAPTDNTVTTDNGHVIVSGKAEPGSTVKVEFPDHTTATATAGKDGSYKIDVSPAPDGSGKVTITATDKDNNTSEKATQDYTDTTPPAPPTDTVITQPNGAVHIEGNATPGSTVTAYLPDGTTATTTADQNGHYVIDAPSQPNGGTISVTATDKDNNVSAKVTQDYEDKTPPDQPTAYAAENTNGGMSINGTAEPGSTVTAYLPDGTTATTKADKDGNYVISAVAQPNGPYRVTATDPAGNTSKAATGDYTDNNKPRDPSIDVKPNDPEDPSKGTHISGTAEPGSTVTITDKDGNPLATIVVGPDGKYEYDTTASGPFTVTVKDPANHTSDPVTSPTIDAITPTDNGGIHVDGSAAKGSTVTVHYPDGSTATATVGADGKYAFDSTTPQGSGNVVVSVTDRSPDKNPIGSVVQHYTDTTAPQVPTVDPITTDDATGHVTVSGKAEPGSTVTAKFPDNTVASATADANGNYKIDVYPAPDGSGKVTITATDKDHNTSAAASTDYTDTTPPAPPTDTTITQPNGAVHIEGNATPGSTVTAYLPDGSTKTTTADQNGHYVIDAPSQPKGEISVTTKDAEGNESAKVTQDYTDTTPPAKPTASVSENDNGGMHIEGTAEPGSKITVNLPDGTTATATAGADGKYSIDTVAQPDGPYSVTATDPANNTSEAATGTYTDTHSPKDPTIDVTPTDPTDPSQGTHISGTAEPGSTITVTDPSGNPIRITDKDGNPILDKDGNPTNSIVVGPDGKYDFYTPDNGPFMVTVKDPAGHESNPVTSPTIDEIGANDDGSIHVEGSAAPGSTVTIHYPDDTTATTTADDDGDYTFDSPTPQTSGHVIVEVPGAKVTQYYTDTTPPLAPVVDGITTDPITHHVTVSGTAEPGSTVTAKFPDGTSATATAGKDGSYTIDVYPAPRGTSDATVTATDKAGNESDPATGDGIHYTDITPPDVPTGSVTLSSDGHAIVSGTAEPGSTVKVVFPDNSSATATADKDGNYKIDVNPAPSGSGNVSITATDKDNNTSQAGSASYNDGHTTPGAPTTQATVTGITPDNGDSSSDYITNAKTVTISGTLNAALKTGETLQINLGDGKWLGVTVDSGAKSWSYNASLADGNYSITTKVTNTSGDGPTSASRALVIDTQTPTEVATLNTVDSNPATYTGGFATSNSQPTLTGTLNSVLNNGKTGNGSAEKLQINLGGSGWQDVTVNGTSWSYTPATALANGNCTVLLRVVDVAGNQQIPASFFTLQVQVADQKPINGIAITGIDPDNGLLSTDMITNTGAITISGKLEKALTGDQYVLLSTDGGNSWVNSTDSGSLLTVDNSGLTWRYVGFNSAGKPLDQGSYNVLVQIAHNGGSVDATDMATIVIDKTTPTESASLTAITPDSAMAGDFITSNGKPVFSGTLGAPLADGSVSGESKEMLLISIINSAGKSITGGYVQATVTGQSWEYALPAGVTLADDTYRVSLQVSDLAGNATNPPITDAQTVTIDKAAPTETFVQTKDGYYTLSSPDDSAQIKGVNTSSADVVLTGQYNGTLANGKTPGQSPEHIQVSINGGAWMTVPDKQANGGTWSLECTLPIGGSNTVSLRVVDDAGNASDVTKATPIYYTVGLGSIRTAIASMAQDTGDSPSDFITKTNVITVQGSITDASGTPVTLGDGQIVEWNLVNAYGVSLSGGWNIDNKANAPVGASNWTVSDLIGLKLGDGSYTLLTRVYDTAVGKSSLAAQQTITIDSYGYSGLVNINTIAPDTSTHVNVSGKVSEALADGSVGGKSKEYLQVRVVGEDGALGNGDGDGWQTVAVSANGNWTYSVSSDSALDGKYTVETQVVDVAGNITPSNSKGFTIDNSAPANIPTITGITPDSGTPGDFITNLNGGHTLTVNGTVTLQAGQKLQVSANNGSSWQDVTVNNGLWSQDISSIASADGVYTVQARVINTAGLAGSVASQDIIIDTTRPAEVVDITAISTDNGMSGSDFITNSGSQTFTGSIAPALTQSTTGAVSAETLWVNITSGKTGDSITSGFVKATINANGTWSWTAPGGGLTDDTYTVQLQVRDAAGNKGDIQTGSHVVLVDSHTSSVALGQSFTITSSDAGAITNDLTTTGTHVTLSGTYTGTLADGKAAGVSAEHIQVQIGGGDWVNATASNGTWTLTWSKALVAGDNAVKVRVADDAGNIDSSGVSDTIVVTSGLGNISTAITGISPDSGTPGDFITNLGSASAVMVKGNIVDGGGNLTTLGANQVVQYNILGPDGTTSMSYGWQTASVAGNAWSFNVTSGSGSYTIQTRVWDNDLGKNSTPVEHSLVIDTGIYMGTVGFTALTPDTGVQNDWITSSTTGISISGTVSAPLADGSKSGQSAESLQVRIVDSSGSPVSGGDWQTVTVSGTGWTFSLPGTTTLTSGVYQVQAQVVDVAGNITPSNSKPFTIDTSVPPAGLVTITGITPDSSSASPQIGTGSDFITNSSGTLILSGGSALQAGQTMQVSLNNGGTWTTVLPGMGGAWTLDISSLAKTDGNYTVQVRAVSAAGVAGPAASQVVVIDTTAPAETVTLTGVSGGGVLDNGGFFSASTAPTLNGKLSVSLNSNSGSTEALFINLGDGSGWHQVTNVSGQSWSFDTTSLNLGSKVYSVQLEVVDTAGNVGAPSPTYTLNVNTKPTETPINLNISPDTATKGDWITSVAGTSKTLTVTGALDKALGENEVVQVSLDGTNWFKATTVNSDLTWSIDVPNVADGSYTITAEVINTATNQPGATATHTVQVDSTAPAEVITITGMSGPAGTQTSGSASTGFTTSATTGITFNGVVDLLVQNATADATAETLQISFDGGKNWQTVTDFRGTNDNGKLVWAYTMTKSDPALAANASNAIQMQIVDAAGNVGQGSGSVNTITVKQVSPPSFSTLSYRLDAGSDDGASQTDSSTSIATPTIVGSVATNDAATKAALAAGDITVQIYIDTNGDGIPDAGDQILGTSTVKSDGTFSVTLSSLTPGVYTGNTAILAALGNSGVYTSTSDNPTNVVFQTSGGTATSKSITITAGVASEIHTQSTQDLTLGYAMTAIGDFNGDGYADYFVTAPANKQGNRVANGSVAYILYGGPNGLPNVGDLKNLSATQGIKITDTNTPARVGGSDSNIQGMTVMDVGDINGDGFNDIAIASNLDDRIYVLFGNGNNPGTFSLTSLEAAANANGFVVRQTHNDNNSHSGSYLGSSVAGADINGDGYSDLIFGAPQSGNYYVIYGHSGSFTDYSIRYTDGTHSGPLTVAGSNGYAGTTAATGTSMVQVGTTYSNWLGGVIGAVGDVNGDGYADYVVTAPEGGSNNAGVAYLLFGGPNGLPANFDLSTLTPAQGITLTSTQANEYLGGSSDPGSGNSNGRQADAWYAQYHSVTSLGDINGDGYADFAIGSPGAKGAAAPVGGDGAGAVYVVYGTAAGVNWSNLTLPSYNGSTFSNTLAGKGFVIYSTAYSSKATGTGNTGSNNSSALGFSVSGVGDVNGDGLDDFLIGAPMANSGAGAVFLVFGTAGGLPGASTGVVDLDKLVAAGKATGVPFGTPGTAIEYDGAKGGGVSGNATNTYMGTDVTGGDYSGTGISGYSFGAWGYSIGTATATRGLGETFTYNGTTAYLTQAYTVGDDILYAGTQGIGMAAITNTTTGVSANHLTGGQGNDWLHGIGQYAGDVGYGGAGNDFIGISSTNFTRVNGGSGVDTLVFEGNNMTLNLATMGLKVQGFEKFDLNNQSNTAATDPQGKVTGLTTGNTLQLRLSDILSEPDAIYPDGSLRMTIMGDSSSKVVLDGTSSLAASNWVINGSQTVKDVTYDIYHNTTMANGYTVADLLIQQGVQVI